MMGGGIRKRYILNFFKFFIFFIQKVSYILCFGVRMFAGLPAQTDVLITNLFLHSLNGLKTRFENCITLGQLGIVGKYKHVC